MSSSTLRPLRPHLVVQASWRRACAAVLSGAVLFAGGCAAASGSVSYTPSPSVVLSVPAGTAPMSSLGWKNGAAGRVLLPVTAGIDTRIDQANVITAVGHASDTASVLTTLNDTLGMYGWTIEASGGGSLVFSDATYEGAFTSDATVWALTIRVKA